ncbi:protein MICRORCHIDIA 6-like isoform X2 [Cornus florida]|nr:protein MICRORCHIDIA 6-like isoform X2 [Cornus florida]
MFLHSNATSHKWAFGAIAELLDNAVDEIPNGATFVVIDEITNPRDGSPALLIQDDGGGMDPEALRRCMSFGFSDKNLISTIGQYGNGFKTSSMRLGADVIVFTCHSKKRMLSQSIGLLSYTFLRQTGHGKIVVPMVDYEFNASTRKFKPMLPHGKENFSSNLSILLQWSPYLTEETLLKQFDDIGQHGTKIVIYNLWLNDDGDLELDFNVDAEDIHISVGPKVIQKGHHPKPVFDHHIANLYRYSLRVYISILYLRLPESFKIILRGRVVEHHNIANDLKFFDFILYKPRVGGSMEAAVVTTIGFLKDAPHVDIHGFNIYHKNRLILPFWHVVNKTNRHGRGVVGVLEANFIEPIHSKQDFEKTPLFQKLETRLREMTMEYWECYCEFIGYQRKKKSSPVSVPSQHGLNMKRKEQASAMELEHAKRPSGSGSYAADTLHIGVEKLASSNELQLNDKETILMQANEKLHLRLMGSEQREKELKLKVEQLRSELADKKLEYSRMLAELESIDTMKMEKNDRNCKLHSFLGHTSTFITG